MPRYRLLAISLIIGSAGVGLGLAEAQSTVPRQERASRHLRTPDDGSLQSGAERWQDG